MHIKIEDDGETKAVLCMERGHSVARILYSEPEHVPNLTSIAKSLGAGVIIVEVDPSDVEEFESMQYQLVPAAKFIPMWRSLDNGPKSKRS